MVVQVVRPEIRRRPENGAALNGAATPEHPVLELVGGAQRLRSAPTPPNAPLLTHDETLRALRLLAVDSLVDVVHLRETVATQNTRIKALETELQTWRERALTEAEDRRSDVLAAHRRERDLISVVHHQMLTTQSMSDELDRKRRRIWRRRRHAA